MKNLIIAIFASLLFLGCSMINPGYISSKPDIEKLMSTKAQYSMLREYWASLHTTL